MAAAPPIRLIDNDISIHASKSSDNTTLTSTDAQLQLWMQPIQDAFHNHGTDPAAPLEALRLLHWQLEQWKQPISDDLSRALIDSLLHTCVTSPPADTTITTIMRDCIWIASSRSVENTLRAVLESLQSLASKDSGEKNSNIKGQGVSPAALANTLSLLEDLLLADPGPLADHKASEAKQGLQTETENTFAHCLNRCKEQGLAMGLFLMERVDKESNYAQEILPFVQEWVEILLRVPRWVSNACLAQKLPAVPSYWTSPRYLPNLVQNASRHVLQNLVQDETKRFWTCLVRTMIQQQMADRVVVGLWLVYLERDHHNLSPLDHENVLMCWKNAMALLTTGKESMSAREVALLCRSLLCLWASKKKKDCAKESEKWVHLVLQTLLGSSRDAQDAVIRACVFTLVKPNEIGSILTNVFCSLDDSTKFQQEHPETDTDVDVDVDESQSLSPLIRVLGDVAVTWSSILFVRKTDTLLQRQVSTFLTLGLDELIKSTPALDPIAHGELISGLLQGTTHRLESSIATIRLDGMRVAKSLAKNLGQELNFDELESDQASETNDATRKEETATKEKSNAEADASEGQIFDDDDSVWEDDLEAYDLVDDEEDLRETPKPLYLRDALEMLRTSENDEHAFSNHETALKELPALIRSRPYDLPDIATDLLVEILHHENKFDMKLYPEFKLSGMLALTVTQPQGIGMALITEVFGSCSLLTRLHVLSTLQEAAFELSGMKQLEEMEKQSLPTLSNNQNRVRGKHRFVANTEDDSLLAISESVDKQLESRSRRWGKGSLSKKNHDSGFVNSFSNVAPLWFYGMIGNFVERREDAVLWGGTIGARFLAYLLMTLGTVLEYSGTSVATNTMAKDLFGLVWGFCQQAVIPEVRMAALSGVATSLACIQDTSTFEKLLQDDSGNRLLDVLLEIGRKDADTKCRQLAKSILAQVQGALERQRKSAYFLD